jgi:hypothetical protein
MAQVTYPEHDKLAKVTDHSQAIGEFLDWLQNERGVTLAHYDDNYIQGDVLTPIFRSIEDWLAIYFDIDRNRLEEEKREMLRLQREANG